MQVCNIPGCIFEGHYCRIHKDEPVKKKVGKDSALVLWYENKIAQCQWICLECGKSCYTTDRNFQFAAQAHVLPKSKQSGFPSVATHDLNHLCLGPSCGCHGKYDSSWQNASQMKIWPVAMQIIIVLAPLLPQSEYRRLPDFIKDQLESKNVHALYMG